MSSDTWILIGAIAAGGMLGFELGRLTAFAWLAKQAARYHAEEDDE